MMIYVYDESYTPRELSFYDMKRLFMVTCFFVDIHKINDMNGD